MMSGSQSSTRGEPEPATTIGSIVVDTDRVSFYAFRPDRAGPAVASNSAAVPSGDDDVAADGRAEQDAADVLAAVRDCVGRTASAAGRVMGARVAAVGIANHRGSVVAWNRRTGRPLSRLIMWTDTRAAAAVDAYRRAVGRLRFQGTCGLPFSPQFSAFKIKWLIDHDDAVRAACRLGDCCFGTVDAWLVWNLTGGAEQGVFATDTSNAAHTFLMNINTLEWDNELLAFFDIPQSSLPKIKTSSELYGHIADGPLKGVPITGVIGNIQASLIGHGCFRSGLTKITMDIDGSVFTIIGKDKVFSDNGLSTTIAYHLDKNPVFALEGPIDSARKSIKWLKKCPNVEGAESLTSKILGNKRHLLHYFPASNGLYKRPKTRRVGINEYVVKNDILYKVAIESPCHQVQDILEATNADLKISINKLRVDGYLSSNKFVMQSLADVTNTHIEVSTSNEIETAFGSAMAAGYGAKTEHWNTLCMPEAKGNMTIDDRKNCTSDWKRRTLRKSFGWVKCKKPTDRYWLAGAAAAVGVGALLLYGGYSVFRRS